MTHAHPGDDHRRDADSRDGGAFDVAAFDVAAFELDGTLVDSNYQHALAWFRAFRAHDITLPIWRIDRSIGMGGDQLVAEVAGDDVEKRLGDDLRALRKKEFVESTKPAPDLVNAAVEKVNGRRGILVGDSTWDCQSAARPGAPSYALPTGGFSTAELEAAGAAGVYESLTDLLDDLDRTALKGAGR